MSEHSTDKDQSDQSEGYSDGSSEYGIEWTVNLMELPLELQAKVFHNLPDYQTAIALRLCCHQLNGIYLAQEKSILANLRELIVAPFREYYDFLQRLKLPANSVEMPPASGWPNFTAEVCAGSVKTPFAMDVLKHLPCIHDEEDQSNTTNIDYKCNAVDYSELTSEDLKTYDGASFWAEEWQGESTGSGEEGCISNLKNVVLVADGYESGGVVLLLDTLTGTIFEEIVRMGNGQRLPVHEYFAERMEKLRNLEQIFIPGYDPVELDRESDSDVGSEVGSEADSDVGSEVGSEVDNEADHSDVDNEADGEVDSKVDRTYDADRMEKQGEPSGEDDCYEAQFLWLRHLYYKFGWPGSDWKRDECMRAVEEYYNRVY